MERSDVTRLLKYCEAILTPVLEPYLFERTHLPPFFTLDVATGTMVFWAVGDGEYETMIPIDRCPTDSPEKHIKL